MSGNLELPTILIVDDQPQNINILGSFLRPNYKVLAVTHGVKAIEIAKSNNSIDLILLDIMMPDIDGYETCSRLKQEKKCKDIPVIFVSALQEAKDKIKGFSVGGVDFVSKPIQPDEVLARANAHIQLRRMQKMLQTSNDLLEQKVKERTIELEEALAHNKLLLNSVGDGIYGLDLNGKTTFVNPSMCALLNYSHDELLGNSMHDIVHHSRSDGSNYDLQECDIHNISSSHEVNRDVNDLFWRKNGTSLPVELTSAPIYKDKKLHGRVITLRDVSEKEKLDKAKKEFVYTVSHELRTPLTSIIVGLELIMGGNIGEASEAVKELVTMAKLNSQHLLFLINDLLDAGKIESGKLTLNFKQVTINEVIQRAIYANKGFSNKYKVPVHWQRNETNIIVNADADRLVQVVLNLLSNAIKYSNKNTPVEVFSSIQNDHIRITVKDLGSGIPDNFRSVIFDRFTQADTSDTRRVGGTGLGLAISKEIIEGHNGILNFKTVSGEGTEFYFDLPITC